jgi:hypothetical protein
MKLFWHTVREDSSPVGVLDGVEVEDDASDKPEVEAAAEVPDGVLEVGDGRGVKVEVFSLSGRISP